VTSTSPPRAEDPSAEAGLVPETVRIPAGRLQRPDELCASIPIASFRFGRTPVTNREYSFFLARGGAREPPW
jgi:formylglycine-generating enzyme required for sulfatase activity